MYFNSYAIRDTLFISFINIYFYFNTRYIIFVQLSILNKFHWELN